MLYAVLFTIGSILITALIYLALNPKSVEVEGETADLRFVGFALILIILTAATVAAMLLLGKIDEVKMPF